MVAPKDACDSSVASAAMLSCTQNAAACGLSTMSKFVTHPILQTSLTYLSPMAETQWLLTDKSPSAGSISMSDGADRSTDCMAPPTEHHEKAHIHCPGYSNSFAAAAHLHVQRTGQQRRHAAPGSLDGRLQPSAAAALSAAPPTAPPLLPAGEEGQMKRGSLLGNMQSASHLRSPGLQALIQRIKGPHDSRHAHCCNHFLGHFDMPAKRAGV